MMGRIFDAPIYLNLARSCDLARESPIHTLGINAQMQLNSIQICPFLKKWSCQSSINADKTSQQVAQLTLNSANTRISDAQTTSLTSQQVAQLTLKEANTRISDAQTTL